MPLTKRVSIHDEPAVVSPSEPIDRQLDRLALDSPPSPSRSGSGSVPPSILRHSTTSSLPSMSDLPRTLTQTSAHSASSSSSHSHAHSHSSFVRAILPHSHKKDGHHSHSHHGRSSSHVRAAHVTPPSTPVALCELFLSVMFTHPSGRSLDEIQAELGPRLVHRAYVHRVNCRECDVEEMWEMARFFRTKFDSSRVRVKHVLMDQDGTATMAQAAVALTYDVIGVIHRGKHAEPEEVKVSCVGVFKIYEGMLAQGDIVVDTSPWHLFNLAPQQEVGCIVA